MLCTARPTERRQRRERQAEPRLCPAEPARPGAREGTNEVQRMVIAKHLGF